MDPIIPTEEDSTLLLETASTQYPGATGLKYRFQDCTRGVKIVNGKLYPPEGGWSDRAYYVILAKQFEPSASNEMCGVI